MLCKLALVWAITAAVSFQEDLSKPLSSDQWAEVTGLFKVRDGALYSAPSGECWLVRRSVLPPKAVVVEADVTPEQGKVPGQWCAAGIAAWLASNSYWRLALVENAADKDLRYFELVEKLNGVWQAQNERTTYLKSTGGGEAAWEYGHSYHFRLECTQERVTGTISEGGKVIWQRSFEMPPTVEACRGGMPAVTTMSMVARFENLRGEMEPVVLRRRAGPPLVLVLDNDLPGAEAGLARMLASAVERAGLRVDLQPISELIQKQPTAAECDVLVVPSAQVVPAGAGPAIAHYLSSGGQLVVTASGTPFERQLVPVAGQWMTPEEAQACVKATGTVVSVADDLPAKLRVATNAPEHRKTVTVEEPPRMVGGKALHFRLEQFDGWTTWGIPLSPGTLSDENPVLLFWAKGDEQTTHLTIELGERDGSRWIGSVPISTDWRRYGISAHSLPFWPDCPTRGIRGGSQDHVKLAEVVEVRVGLAKTHGALPDGPKEFWLSSIEAGPVVREAASEALAVPELEAIAPFYKTFPYPKVAQIATPAGSIFGEIGFRYAEPLRATYARPWGRAMTGRREKRWIPILEARDDQGGHMYAAALHVQAGGRFAGATWSYWGLPLAAFEAGGAELQQLFARVVAAQARRLWMVEAGPDQVAYMPDQQPKAGARLINLGPDDARVEMAVRISRDGAPITAFTRSVAVEALSEKTVLEAWQPEGPGVYEVAVELRQDGTVIDRITCPARILSDEQPSPESYIRVENGRFRLSGKPWFPHGANFWPRYVSGMSTTDYWLHWQNAAHYDPVLVEEDLVIAEALGITALSIQPPWNEQDIPCLWDFLERCRAHGIRVNLFVHVDPRGFDAKYVDALIGRGRLSRFPSLYAYDITWEPRWGGYEERCRYDNHWREWVNDQYGSLQAAEQIWGFQAPRNEQGEITGPTDDQLRNDGPWRVMVAAYRRFVDDFLSSGYGRSCRFIRARDPYHLISNRAGYGGTGNEWVVGVYQFDPLSGAAHLDFISPEAYGMRPEEGDYRRWGFVDAYCRWAGNGKPVFWSEYGASIWPGYKPQDYEAQRLIWENVQRLVLFAGADGDAGWWWPGGYRVDEKSDFGCIEPWGESRPSALELRKWASQICSRSDEARPARWLEIDRDSCVQGLHGLWVKHLDEYLAAADEEHLVRLTTAAERKSTVDLELIGVGNVSYSGAGPVKGLNAELEAVSLEVDGQTYRPQADLLFGEIHIAVPGGRPATVHLALLNTGEATWACEQSAGGRPGAVRLIDAATGQPLAAIPSDVSRYGRCSLEFPLKQTPDPGQQQRLLLRLEATGRCRFGQAIKLVLAAQ